MRKTLKSINGTRDFFTGTIERIGTKSSFGHPKKTLLLIDIRNQDNELVTDHLWFNMTKGFEKVGVGNRVKFCARVKPYEKGYKGYREDVYQPISTDYKLSHPTKIEVLK